jgi:S1-C subfamily serine protease
MVKRLRLLLPLLALLLASAPAHADDAPAIYQRILKSVVWIKSDRSRGFATGTGSIVDKPRRLVLTNYHVVGDNPHAVVMFPAYHDGKLIAERDWYVERLSRNGIKGKVIALDKKHDLALLQLEELPKDAEALKLATTSPAPGESVHSVGNPGDSGGLWIYTAGKVRQVYAKKWEAKVGSDTVHFESEVVETDSAINPGDSGGPLVDDKGQLVGVTHGVSTTARLLSTFIDIAEVHRILNSAEAQKISAPTTPATRGGFAIRDDAKMFSAETVQKANEVIKKLAKDQDRDLLVETFEQVPEADRDKVKAMDKDQREKYFSRWGSDRIRTEGVQGVYVLVCKDPAHLEVRFTENAEKAFDKEARQKLIDLLLSRFKEKKFDEGLTEAVDMVRDRFEKAKP